MMPSSGEYRILPYGDSYIYVAFKNEISEAVNDRVVALCGAIDNASFSWVKNCIPAYCTLLIEYDSTAIGFNTASQCVRELVNSGKANPVNRRTVIIPVCYGGEYGPDMQVLCSHCGLSPEEVTAIHSSPEYRVYMLGFRPGFPYLGGMDGRIAMPRKQTPRLKVPAGSCGIAGEQTGIYPCESPGGWQIIGRTPLKLFDAGRQEPSLLRAGDLVKFKPITESEFRDIEKGEAWLR